MGEEPNGMHTQESSCVEGAPVELDEMCTFDSPDPEAAEVKANEMTEALPCLEAATIELNEVATQHVPCSHDASVEPNAEALPGSEDEAVEPNAREAVGSPCSHDATANSSHADQIAMTMIALGA